MAGRVCLSVEGLLLFLVYVITLPLCTGSGSAARGAPCARGKCVGRLNVITNSGGNVSCHNCLARGRFTFFASTTCSLRGGSLGLLAGFVCGNSICDGGSSVLGLCTNNNIRLKTALRCLEGSNTSTSVSISGPMGLYVNLGTVVKVR